MGFAAPKQPGLKQEGPGKTEDTVRITYLLNSGFLLETGRTLLVFDYFMDPAHAVERAIDEGGYDQLYFFASHAHEDHFDSRIRAYAQYTTRYIFSSDIKQTARARAFSADSVVYMKKYSSWEDENLRVQSFDSTDVGTCFLTELKASGLRIFHAGDFNWWHWEGDTHENQKLAENGFRKQMKKLKGLEADLAFFPVDGRLEGSAELGAAEFLKETRVKVLTAMHRVGYPRWEPSSAFFGDSPPIPTWSPAEPGETVLYDEMKQRLEPAK